MADLTPQQLAQQLARAEVEKCIARLVTLSQGKGGRGAANALRATLALLELAGVTTPASTGSEPGQTSPRDASAPPDAVAGGQGVKLKLVDADGVRRFYEQQKGGKP